MAADETQPYGYNVRDELISGQAKTYAYDDIGNRTVAEGKTYVANNLNQYIAIDDFTPQYDADGNQTLIKTETGIWSVVYNAENLPIRWQSGDTVITMSFDRMGRRVEMRTMKDSTETFQRFVYDNYLCIQQLRGPDNSLYHSYIWDPTEPIATRPLIFIPSAGETAYYFHDGNKNVSDFVSTSGALIHCDYTSFGTPTTTALSESPYWYSSEFYDKSLGLVYYNYRHYCSISGRWGTRDPLESETMCSHLFLCNSPLRANDYLGLKERAYISGYVKLHQYAGVFFFNTAKTLFSSSYRFATECSDDGSSVIFFDQKDGNGDYRFKITNTNDGHFQVLFVETSSGNGTADFLKSVSLSVGEAVSYEAIVTYVTTGTLTGGTSVSVIAAKAALEAAVVNYLSTLDKHSWSIVYKKAGNVTCECFVDEKGEKAYRPVVSPSKADVQYHKGSELFWGTAWGDFFWDGGTSSSVRY